MTSLRDLLQQAADRGLSTRVMESEVERASAASNKDMKLSRGTASLILSGKYKSKPSDSTIRAVAYLAQVPEKVAFEAAGKPAPALPFADELPEGVDQLSPRRRRTALEMLRMLVEAEQLEHLVELHRDSPDSLLDVLQTMPPEQRDRVIDAIGEERVMNMNLASVLILIADEVIKPSTRNRKTARIKRHTETPLREQMAEHLVAIRNQAVHNPPRRSRPQELPAAPPPFNPDHELAAWRHDKSDLPNDDYDDDVELDCRPDDDDFEGR